MSDTQVGADDQPRPLDKVRGYIETGAEGRRDYPVRRPERPSYAAELPPELQHGNFIWPTVFADVDNRMRIAQEEIFGPVACLIPFKDEADAIAKANDIHYGLSSYVWTENLGRRTAVAAAIEAGCASSTARTCATCASHLAASRRRASVARAAPGAYEVFLEPKNVCVSPGLTPHATLGHADGLAAPRPH